MRIQRCSLCKEIKGTNSAYYCSYACLEADWHERHKEWHQRQKAAAAQLAGLPHVWIEAAEKAESEFARLLYRSWHHLAEHDPKQAARGAKEAIALEPRSIPAHTVLALAYFSALDPREVHVHLDQMRLKEPGTKEWANSALDAWIQCDPNGNHFDHFHPCSQEFCDQPCCAAASSLPAWLRVAADMKEMADRCVSAVPDDWRARAMLATALSWLSAWEAAGGAWIQAARLRLRTSSEWESDDETSQRAILASKQQFLEFARECFATGKCFARMRAAREARRTGAGEVVIEVD